MTDFDDTYTDEDRLAIERIRALMRTEFPDARDPTYTRPRWRRALDHLLPWRRT